MLSYALAIAVALSSLILFLTAFLMSDIHRKDDFLWSGVGLFYALVLWFCARNITGAVLLGQASASILLVSFVWQTLKLRKAIANPEKAAEINSFSVLQTATNLLKRKKKQPSTTPPKSAVESPDVVKQSDISIPQTTSDKTKAATEAEVSVDRKDKKDSLGKSFGNKKRDITPSINVDKNLQEKPEETKILADRENTENSNKPQLDTEIVSEKSSTSTTKEDSSDLSISDESAKIDLEQTTKVAEGNTANLEAEKSSEPTARTESDLKTNNEALTEPETETADTNIPVEIESETSPQVEDKSEDIVIPSETSPDDVIAEDKELRPETAKKESPLDFLETVEVAEVLEAESENKSGMRDNDRTNIIDIEVTTTEIPEIDRDSQSEEK